jgi:hypothetical protein
MNHSDLMETLKFALVAVSIVAVVQMIVSFLAGSSEDNK